MKVKNLIGFVLVFLIGIAMLSLIGCSDNNSSNDNGPSNDQNENENSELQPFDQAVFTTPTLVDNEYFPLNVGTVQLYMAETEDGAESIIVEVLEETKMVNGVTCVVVRDRVFLEELLIEDTHDWYAQDDEGNVWYMGEEVINYEYDDEDNIVDTDNDGAWEAGVDGALPGIIMKATLTVGDSYQQEFYEGEAEDMASIEDIGVLVVLEDGSEYEDCLQTLEWNPLEPDSEEYKYYAPNVGLIKEEAVEDEESVEQKGVFFTVVDQIPDFNAATFTNPLIIDNTYLPLSPGNTMTYVSETEDGVETILVEVLEETKVVNGVTCVVVRDQVFLEDLLIEDTHDWYAQDDEGNVWYMGEEVVNYEYDEEDNLIDTDNDGAWEAGVDGALPGIMMWADPEVGVSYYQEYYEDEAEDMGYNVADGVQVELEDGTVYNDCLQVLDWNPLDPAVMEYKFYAPGTGVIKEEVVGGDEKVELI